MNSPAPRRQDSRRYAQVVLGMILCALMFWPAVVNRGVFIFPDSSTYIRGADAAVYKATGLASDWSSEFVARYERPKRASPASTGKADVATDSRPVVLAGRSIYYGALLYVADIIGGLWLMALFQTGVVAAAMIVATRRIDGEHVPRAFPTVLLTVPVLTSVGFYATMMMPDIFAPLAILAGAMIGIYWTAFDRLEKWFWSILLVVALATHSANILIAAIMIGALLVHKLITSNRQTRIVPLMALLGTAFAGELLFSVGIDKMTGHPPVRPPFVLARLIEDGPAYRYLKENCPSRVRFAICRYVDRMPANSDAMLWSTDKRIGIFSAVAPHEQRELAAEQSRVLLSVLADRPGEVVLSVAKSTMRQLGHAGLMEFNGQHADPAKLPPRVRSDYLQTAAANRTMPVAPFALVGQIAALASALAIGAILWARRKDSAWLRPRAQFVALVAVAMLANVVICGALSTPHDRYLTRTLWLIPFIAAALWAGQRKSRS